MAEGQTECREAFEKWASPIGHLPLNRERNYPDEYEHNFTRLSWGVWQACWKNRAESGLVKELVEALEYAATHGRDPQVQHVAKSALAKHQATGQHVEPQPIAGWRFYTADFSRDGRKGSVMLVRDSEGYKWWQSLSDVEQEETDLFVTGFGNTIQEAIIDANAKAKPPAAKAAAEVV